MPVILNDIHSRLNPTRVRELVCPTSEPELVDVIRRSSAPISISGGRHAMGGQQFGDDTINIDTRSLCNVIEFDPSTGLVSAQAGAQWPSLIGEIRQRDTQGKWGIRQKQTGASDLTLGGSLSANIHGRGLRMRPIIGDVESLRLVSPRGEVLKCSRTENQDVFGLAIGGYGLFGIISEVVLRLARRQRVQRCVDVVTVESLMERFDEEIARGTLYGDFQFAIDHNSQDFLHRGIFSRYRPVASEHPIPENQVYFTTEKWLSLLRLARTDRSLAYQRYVKFYQATDGQIYDSDTHQLSTYVPRYHDQLQDLPAEAQGTEVISELYVPRHEFAEFMVKAASILRACEAPLTYGTIRLIEADNETLLQWAKQPYACVILNLLTPETPAGQQRTAATFRQLYDLALGMNGSFYLTYHAYATRAQLDAAYPQMQRFLEEKLRLDPDERFQSSWYRHMRTLYS